MCLDCVWSGSLVPSSKAVIELYKHHNEVCLCALSCLPQWSVSSCASFNSSSAFCRRMQESLDGLDEFSHVWILFWFHLSVESKPKGCVLTLIFLWILFFVSSENILGRDARFW
jgi:hypothetical protein